MWYDLHAGGGWGSALHFRVGRKSPRWSGAPRPEGGTAVRRESPGRDSPPPVWAIRKDSAAAPPPEGPPLSQIPPGTGRKPRENACLGSHSNFRRIEILVRRGSTRQQRARTTYGRSITSAKAAPYTTNIYIYTSWRLRRVGCQI
jgi:hypothetical protein